MATSHSLARLRDPHANNACRGDVRHAARSRRRQGRKAEEIAAELGISRASVFRVLKAQR